MDTVISRETAIVASLEMGTVTSLETDTQISLETVTVTSLATETPGRGIGTSPEKVTVKSLETLILEGVRRLSLIMGVQGDLPTPPPLQTVLLGGDFQTKEEPGDRPTTHPPQLGGILRTLHTVIRPRTIIRVKVRGGIIFLEISTPREEGIILGNKV